MDASSATDEPRRKGLTLRRIVMIILCLTLVYCGQREVRFLREKHIARQICELRGGGGYWTSGPVVVPGYLHNGGANFSYSARYLVDRGFEFVEAPGNSVYGVWKVRGPKPREGYTRYTIEQRPSALCAAWDEYVDRIMRRKRHTQDVIDSRIHPGVAKNECIGIEMFTDSSELRSAYELRRVKEPDPKAPHIIWGKQQAVHRETGQIHSQISGFGRCLSVAVHMEPLYNGCFGGKINTTRCPLKYVRGRSSENRERYKNESFLSVRESEQTR